MAIYNTVKSRVTDTLLRVAGQIYLKAYGAGMWLKSGGAANITSWPINFWQRDYPNLRRGDYERIGPAFTCMKIISEDMSRIPIIHERTEADGSREILTSSSLARVFRKPNRYQTKSDFILYILRSLLFDGNAYVWAKRNNRGAPNIGGIQEMYPLAPSMVTPYIDPEEQGVYYRISHDATSELAQIHPEDEWIPQRDMLHIRMHTPKHPLVGETPLVAATTPLETNFAINHHTADFFRNMGRPSGILRHPGALEPEAMQRIKDRFKEVLAGGNTGEPIILREGMDWTPLTMNAVDSEIIASYNLTERQIAQVYRIPSFLLGDLEKSSLNNVESLIRFYLQSCLGFYVDHVEEAFTTFFELPLNEHIVFDLEQALLRGDFEQRMNGYAKGVQNAVFAPNEARRRERLPPAEFGDEPRVQQQLVPLSYGMLVQPPVPGGSALSVPKVEEEEEVTPEPPENEEKKVVELYNFLSKAANE